MPNLENLKKQAKQLVRWHRERNYSVCSRIRAALPEFRDASDEEILRRRFTLAEAQRVLAADAGLGSWAELRSGAAAMSTAANPPSADPRLTIARPQLFVSDVRAAVAFFGQKLGFSMVYVHGEPPFYGQVERDGIALNLRLVCEGVFAGDVREREQLLAASITVTDVKALYTEFTAAGVEFQQPLRRQPWGAREFVVRDPDGNLVLFGGA